MGQIDCVAGPGFLSRPGAIMRIFVLPGLMACLCVAAYAQYPGHVSKSTETAPTLRATGVFEWTGELSQPKAGRLVPLAVWDGTQYQPGGLYLAQPAPITVLTGTVYELEQAGTPKGLFNVNGAENLNGSWIAIGSVKPEVTVAKKKPPMSKHPPQVVKDAGSSSSNADSDKPTLNRKDADSGSTQSGSSTTNASAADPDRPTLHKRDTNNSSESSSGDSTSTQSTPPVDSDRPTLHRKDSSDGSQNAPAADPERPTLHKSQSNTAGDAGAPVTATENTDPNRPTLRYGKPEAPIGMVEPSKLEGLPLDMNQMAAVSDVKTREAHTFVYSWSDPNDAVKAKTAMEDLAQKALAASSATPAAAPANVTKTGIKAGSTRRKAAAASSLPTLEDEKFSAFELSYNGGATLVLTAKTGEPGAARYVTLIAQPDFYGTPQIIFKQVTSDERLNIVPRMRLVDAVDTDADGRAELIFELRGKTGREFGIYRVVNRSVEQAFNTGPLS
jgi:hypothetical protein